MKPLTLLLLCLLATDATAKERKLHHVFGKPYVFLPDPGAWHTNADGSRWYENERILMVNDPSGTPTAYCKSRVTRVRLADMTRDPDGTYVVSSPAALPQEECDYWNAITFHKGKVDRNEGIEIGVVAASGLIDAWSTARFGTNWESPCHEVGSLGLLGSHPGPIALVTYQLGKTAIFAIPALKTPLAYSSAKVMLGPTAVVSWSALRAARHNLAIGCGG